MTQGIIRKTSLNTVAETIDKLEQLVTDKGFTVIARVNHSGAAAKADLVLADNELLIFGNPQGGTLLMQSQPSAGLDLPLKAQAYVNGEGKVQLVYNDPAYIAERHDISDKPALIEKMQSALATLTDVACQ